MGVMKIKKYFLVGLAGLVVGSVGFAAPALEFIGITGVSIEDLDAASVATFSLTPGPGFDRFKSSPAKLIVDPASIGAELLAQAMVPTNNPTPLNITVALSVNIVNTGGIQTVTFPPTVYTLQNSQLSGPTVKVSAGDGNSCQLAPGALLPYDVRLTVHCGNF